MCEIHFHFKYVHIPISVIYQMDDKKCFKRESYTYIVLFSMTYSVGISRLQFCIRKELYFQTKVLLVSFLNNNLRMYVFAMRAKISQQLDETNNSELPFVCLFVRLQFEVRMVKCEFHLFLLLTKKNHSQGYFTAVCVC